MDRQSAVARGAPTPQTHAGRSEVELFAMLVDLAIAEMEREAVNAPLTQQRKYYDAAAAAAMGGIPWGARQSANRNPRSVAHRTMRPLYCAVRTQSGVPSTGVIVQKSKLPIFRSPAASNAVGPVTPQ